MAITTRSSIRVNARKVARRGGKSWEDGIWTPLDSRNEDTIDVLRCAPDPASEAGSTLLSISKNRNTGEGYPAGTPPLLVILTIK